MTELNEFPCFNLRLIFLLLLVLTNSPSSQSEEWLKEFDMQRHQGKVVYLDFWASWCHSCRKSFPWLNAMQEKYRSRGLVVIGINLDVDIEKAYIFLEKTPTQIKLYSDPSGHLASRYNLTGIPSSIIFDGSGKIEHHYIGFKISNTDRYENMIISSIKKLKN